jgi:hypothetical protein
LADSRSRTLVWLLKRFFSFHATFFTLAQPFMDVNTIKIVTSGGDTAPDPDQSPITYVSLPHEIFHSYSFTLDSSTRICDFVVVYLLFILLFVFSVAGWECLPPQSAGGPRLAAWTLI